MTEERLSCKCPVCKGEIVVCTDPDVILHSLPICKTYEDMPADDFLQLVQRELLN